MASTKIEGKIIFIQHDKNRAEIEYLEKDKIKTLKTGLPTSKNAAGKPGKMAGGHRFLVGDVLRFVIKKTGANNQVKYADEMEYLYNNTLGILLNKAATENKFKGYIKGNDGELFVKEIDSYLFFPLKWGNLEIPPKEEANPSAIWFKLENLHNPDKLYASLYNHNYVPGFQKAVALHKKNGSTMAMITAIKPFGVHLHLFEEKIPAKLAMDETVQKFLEANALSAGSAINISIAHLDANRIQAKIAVMPTRNTDLSSNK